MLCHTILALCGATVVIAQSTTAGSPFLSIIGAVDNYRVSTIGSVSLIQDIDQYRS